MGMTMANRRMFARTVTESDAFLDLSKDAQLLWFHLGLIADDDGFLNNTRMIMRLCGIDESALSELVTKGFLLEFDTGVFLIRDWLIDNQIRADRYHETTFQHEKSLVSLNESKQYVWLPDGCQVVASDKYRLEEESLDQLRQVETSQEKESQEQTREGEHEGEPSPYTQVPCPNCGQVCTAVNEGTYSHLYCPDCGDYINSGSGFEPLV